MLNGHACRHLVAVIFMGLTLPLLSACDNSPNPNFQQELQAGESGSQDDRYTPLQSAPRIREMARWKLEDRQARANLAAQSFGRTYESMLAQLDLEKVESNVEALFASCRTAFAQTLSYQQQVAAKAGSDKPLPDPAAVFSDLHQCREKALRAGKNDDKQVELLTTILRRFSSAGMVLIGVSMMGHADEQAGLKLWKAGDEVLDEDMAGFKLSLKAFRGY